jgi:hypothetical protein
MEIFCDRRLLTFRLLNAVQLGSFLLLHITRYVYHNLSNIIMYYLNKDCVVRGGYNVAN